MLGLFRPGPRRSRPAVEALEERSVPATFTVTNQSDHNPGSLRQAILDANARVGADTIQFAPQLTGTITLTTGELDITDDLVIQGPGANRITVSGNRASRIFDLGEATAPIEVTISGLKLTRGLTTLVGADDGAAVNVADNSLTLRGCVVSGNQSTDSGGAVFVDGGSLTAVNTIFANNGTDDDGGAVHVAGGGRMVARNSKFLGNSADEVGGAIYLESSVATLSLCTISGNTSESAGGAVYMNDGNLTFKYSTISQNTAANGGGLYVNDGRMTIRNSTISGNRANGAPGVNFGGGGILIYNMETLIVNSTISGNVDQVTPNAGSGGGGIHAFNGNTVIRNSTIAFNSTTGSGGGIRMTDFNVGSTRLMLASTIVSNSTAPGGNLDVFRAAGTGRVSAVFSLIQRLPPDFINFRNQGNILGQNPFLLPLADNGGPTLTHAFTVGSPARDAGSNPDQLQFDQRGPGFPRVKNGKIDIGALEL